MNSFKTDSPTFQATVRIINQIAPEKFPVLVTRILQKLHLRVGKYFSDEEEDQLKALLLPTPLIMIQDSADTQSNVATSNDSLAESLRLLLGCISYIYEQAAFTSTGPEPLYQILLAAGLSDPHSKAQLMSPASCLINSCTNWTCAHHRCWVGYGHRKQVTTSVRFCSGFMRIIVK